MIKRYTYGHNFTVDEAKNLVKAFISLKDEKESKLFLSDLLTPQEVEDLSRRFEAARLLQSGMSFNQVRKEMKMSPVTMTKIYRGWKKGRGYKMIIKKLHKL